MASYGTPSQPRRPTQPPATGPSLATPHHRPSPSSPSYPTSLRPSLFHARPSPLSRAQVTHSPATAVATPPTLSAAARLSAPTNTPSSAYLSRTLVASPATSTSTAGPVPRSKLNGIGHGSSNNPFETLSAPAFDSFISSLTTSIRSALQPPVGVELPSVRRARERAERAKEREEAQRLREEAARERERRRAEEEERRERVESGAEDVFGQVRALGGRDEEEEEDVDMADDSEVREEDFAESAAVYPDLDAYKASQPGSVYSPPSLGHTRTPSAEEPLILSSSASPEPTTAVLLMRERPNPDRAPLFVPRAAESVSAPSSDADGATVDGTRAYDERDREETYGLDTAPSAEEQDDEIEQPSPRLHSERELDPDALDEGVKPVERAEAPAGDEYRYSDEEDVEVEADDEDEDEEDEEDERAPRRDPFGRPDVQYRMQRGAAEGDIDNEDEDAAGFADEEEVDGEEEYYAPDDDGSAADMQNASVGSAMDSAEAEWAGRGSARFVVEQDEDEIEPEQEDTPPPGSPAGVQRTEAGTELIELDSSSDEGDAGLPSPPPVQRPPRPISPTLSPARTDTATLPLPHRAMYGATAPPASEPEQPELSAQDAATLEAVLPPWFSVPSATLPVPSASIAAEDEGVSSAALADVEDELETGDSSVELTAQEQAHAPVANVEQLIEEDALLLIQDTEQSEPTTDTAMQVDGAEAIDEIEFFGQGVPGDEVEPGREEPEVDTAMEVEQEDAESEISLEQLYADEDSEDLRPRIPYEAKGKGRAPPTPSEPEAEEDDFDDASSAVSFTSADVRDHLAEWLEKGRPALRDYEPDDLAEKLVELDEQINRARESGSKILLLLEQQFNDMYELYDALVQTEDEDEDDRRDLQDDTRRDREDSPDRSAFDRPETIDDEDDDTSAAARAGLDDIASRLVERYEAGFSDPLLVPTSAHSQTQGGDFAITATILSPVRTTTFDDDPAPDGSTAAQLDVDAVEPSSGTQPDEVLAASAAQPTSSAFSASAAPPTMLVERAPPPAAPASALHEHQLSEHFQLEPGPAPSFDSPVRYKPVPTEHNVDSPVHSDDERSDPTETEAPVRVGVADEELRDGRLVGRFAPLVRMQDASATGRDETQAAPSSGGLVVVDDDEEVPTASPARHAVNDVSHATVNAVDAAPPPTRLVGASPPPVSSADETQPPIINGVAPPRNPDILPDVTPFSTPAVRLDTPAASTGAATESVTASSSEQLAPAPLENPVVPVSSPPFAVTEPTTHTPKRSPALAPLLSEPALSSHFQLEPGPAPAFDSAVRYESVAAEHGVDSPVYSDEERGDPTLADEAPIRVGVTEEESQDATFVASMQPTGESITVSAASMAEVSDYTSAPSGGEGLIVLDDDAPFSVPPSETAAVLAPPSPTRSSPPAEAATAILGATPPPLAVQDREQPPIVAGVAPPQNPDIAVPTSSAGNDPQLAASADATRSAPGQSADTAGSNAEADASTSATGSDAGGDELRFEDYLAFDAADDGQNDGAVIDVDDQSDSQPVTEFASVPVLGLPNNVDFVTSGALVVDEADEEDEAGPTTAPTSGAQASDASNALVEAETVTETSVDPIEVGEPPEQVEDSSTLPGGMDSAVDALDAAAAVDAPSQAPSSEPISYRSEDERDELEEQDEEEDQLANEAETTPLKADRNEALHGEHLSENTDPTQHVAAASVELAAAASSPHVVNVQDAGEWDPSTPIRFGKAVQQEEHVDHHEPAGAPSYAPQVEEPPTTDEERQRYRVEATEVDTDGDGIGPTEVQSVREASVSTANSADDVAASLLASSRAPTVDLDAPGVADEPAEADEEGDEIVVTGRPSRAKAVDKVVESVAARTSPRRTRSSTKAAVDVPEAPPSPVRRSSRLAPETPAPASPRTKRSRPSEGATPDDSNATSSSSKRPRRSMGSTLRAGERASSPVLADSETVRVTRSTGLRLHHHRHAGGSLAPDAPPTPSRRTSTNAAVDDAPLTRSRCSFQRLEVHSRSDASAAPYLFNVPACALSSTIAQNTMREFGVENLGAVEDADECEGIQLGGKTAQDANAVEVMRRRHSAMVPHDDVLTAVRRIVGQDLWDEGACEVLPREELERAGSKRAAANEGEQNGETPGGRAKRRR
ncbi:uncharacterized protein JCM10292_005741 [Rhodotorula paludigena]|uniref:uncharacterized protein n=1 Tax=Rhodotorula paludigena TaxID=86838 RepID=UPI0031793338